MLVKIFLYGALALTRAVRAQDLPKLRLPWGTWEAQQYEPDPNIYLFKNVRFGAQPRRFSAPSSPDWEDDALQRENRSITCNQIKIKKLEHPPGGRNPLAAPDETTHVETEDCLLLDIYVPVKAFLPDAEPLPVIIWVYGGGFAFGSKEQGGVLYTGRSMLSASNYTAIFVAGNYRLGAYGWLAGNYMQDAGTPNAGLHDQALLFEWVRDHIHKVKGNKDKVGAWGLSAGGSSILHHLVREDGAHDPLFRSFAAFSPGFEWAWDNTDDGKLDTMYRTFSDLADCGFDYDIECLRRAPPEALAEANQKLFEQVIERGLFPVGPAVDGKWIKTMPSLALGQGSYWKGIDSAIVSHVMNESGPFVPKEVVDRESFDRYLAEFLPGEALEPQRSRIKGEYDCEARFNGDFRACAGAIIEHLVITCNTRYLADAYPGKTYAMQYAFPLDEVASHGADLIPLFTNDFEEAKSFLLALDLPGMTEEMAALYAGWLTNAVTSTYQGYYASFGVSGDPNTLLESPPLEWSPVDGSDDALSRVLRVQLGGTPEDSFHHVSDERNTKKICSFWKEIAESIAASAGDQTRGEL
ncbi:hypothetical protein J3459_017348 [Metarhizium acridum]|uniref:Carboxylesterase family protein n=1 Tax=Metarhizium acridum (strain CQMa 102) TaxID=655827 RepID=E9EDR0_METAQ|nr:carboxylesterase family protein [Metarhizium acridum CQMa 102]EFY85925.1 carboxylesterase family protein [Metarhizium acridum CQMa 102]KAG8410145.1 hypothetical protein J3459_017348 [Metarhizium acridum]